MGAKTKPQETVSLRTSASARREWAGRGEDDRARPRGSSLARRLGQDRGRRRAAQKILEYLNEKRLL